MKHSTHRVKLWWKKFPNFRQNLSAFVRGWQLVAVGTWSRRVMWPPTATSCHPLTKAERFCRKFGNFFHHNLTLCVECFIRNKYSYYSQHDQIRMRKIRVETWGINQCTSTGSYSNIYINIILFCPFIHQVHWPWSFWSQRHHYVLSRQWWFLPYPSCETLCANLHGCAGEILGHRNLPPLLHELPLAAKP